ncbi:Uncharacterised protein [Dermatophilus congolensis]|uniref:ATP synthase protein I n=1 Tax=Dermatophilus congolensis TaxID=1863 RepID=A0AA46GZN1_9MICO|nr:hypothetical protein [Dermatophilus congolensis]STD04793.1 Uncharacterised protein [Dermatophilus congolensis]
MTSTMTHSRARIITDVGVESAFKPMMLTACCASAAAALITTVTAIAFGPDGAALASFAGATFAAHFFAMGALGIWLILRGPTANYLVGALGVYVIQVIALGVVLMQLPRIHMPAPEWFSASVAVEVVVWQSAQAYSLLRARVFAYSTAERGES